MKTLEPSLNLVALGALLLGKPVEGDIGEQNFAYDPEKYKNTNNTIPLFDLYLLARYIDDSIAEAYSGKYILNSNVLSYQTLINRPFEKVFNNKNKTADLCIYPSIQEYTDKKRKHMYGSKDEITERLRQLLAKDNIQIDMISQKDNSYYFATGLMIQNRPYESDIYDKDEIAWQEVIKGALEVLYRNYYEAFLQAGETLDSQKFISAVYSALKYYEKICANCGTEK